MVTHRIQVPRKRNRLKLLGRALKCLFTGKFEVGFKNGPRPVKQVDEHVSSSFSYDEFRTYQRETTKRSSRFWDSFDRAFNKGDR